MTAPPNASDAPPAAESRAARLLPHLPVIALANLALVQPLLDVLGASPEFFVAHGTTPTDLLMFVAALCLLAPAPFLLLSVLGARVPPARRALWFLAIASLSTLLLLPPAKRWVPARGEVVLACALAGGAAAALLYLRVAWARSFATALCLAIPVVPLHFLFLTPARGVLLADAQEVSLAEASVSSRAPVVLIALDELALPSLLTPDGAQIDSTRFPGFGALADCSTWYRNATTVSPVTVYAIPALLTGVAPGETVEPLVPHAAGYPHNLFTLLGKDYEIHAFESVTRLCPSDLAGLGAAGSSRASRLRWLGSDVRFVLLRILLPSDVAVWLPDVTKNLAGFALRPASPAPGESEPPAASGAALRHRHRGHFFQTFIETLAGARGEQPTLHFLHVLLPHHEWEYMADGSRYTWSSDAGLNEHTWDDDPRGAIHGHQRYLQQVGFVDRLLARTLQTLRESGRLDETLLIVTADHGVSFRAGQPRRLLTDEVRAEILRVPLLVKLPGQSAGQVSRRPVNTTDVLPTIAEVLGVRLPWRVSGRSVLSGEPPTRAANGYDVTTAQAEEELAAVIALRRERFGAGSSLNEVLAYGPHRALAGRALSALRVEDAPLRVTLAGTGAYRDVDPGASWQPCHLAGSIASRAEPLAGRAVAVALNGVVRAVTRTAADGSGRFAALLPPEHFVAGANEVEALLIAGPPEAPTLLRATPASYGLRRGADGEALLLPSGAVQAIGTAEVLGSLEELRATPEGALEAEGWVVDRATLRPVERLVFFADGIFLTYGSPTLARKDVREVVGAAISSDRAGFRVRVPAPEGASVRVFAVTAGGEVAELPRAGG